MAVGFRLEIFCFATVYLTIRTAGLSLPLSQAVDSPGPLTTVSLNVSNPAPVGLCTSSLIWTGRTAFDAELTQNCYQAWRTFMATDVATYKNTEFEFLQPGDEGSHPRVPKMVSPRRYISSESIAHF